MLDNYLEGLVKEAEVKAEESAISVLPFDELAKLAGIKVSMGKCSGCGSEMEKAGAMFKCGSCGMKKHAEKTAGIPSAVIGGALGATGGAYGAGEGKRLSGALAGGALGAGAGALGSHLIGRYARKGVESLERHGGKYMENVMQAMGRGAGTIPPPPPEMATEMARLGIRGMKGMGMNVAGAAATPVAAYGVGRLMREPEKPEPSAEKTSAADLELEKFASSVFDVYKACNGDMDKVAAVLEDAGMDKEAIGAALSALGKGLGSAMNLARSGAGMKAGLQSAGKAFGRFGKGIKQTYQTGARGGLASGVAGPMAAGQGGIMQGVKAVAKENPYLAAGTAAGAAAGAGALGHKMVTASLEGTELLKVGDAAGRLLAKMAMEPGGEAMIGGVPLSELRESIEEARGREDPAARGRSWQIGGGIAGGAIGAGLGLGAGLLARKLGLGGSGKLLPALTAGSFGAGGALLGQGIGKQHGKGEAEADLLLQKLRGQQAYGAGGEHGYRTGARRGYEAGGMAGFRAGLMRGRGGSPQPGR